MDSSGARFNPAMYPNIPLYNIQAVAAATGVATITLRSWERRYGVPRPTRDEKGYRLYSDRDIAITRWLKDRVEQGVGISRAVHMLQVIEGEPETPVENQTFDFTSLQQRLLQAIANLDDAATERVVSEALTVATVEEVCLRLLQPTLYEVGDLWQHGQLSVTGEHVASAMIRSHLAQLIRVSPAPLRDEQILLGCAPGELHEIGCLILALFLRRRGFDVLYAGASMEQESLIADVERVRPAAICLSVNTIASLNALHDLYSELATSYGGVRGFGGRIFQDAPHLVARVDGVYLGNDAAEGTRTLERLLLSRGAPARGDGDGHNVE